MKLNLLFSAAVAAMLLGACNNQNPTDNATAEASATTASTDEHAGHADMAADGAGSGATASLTGAMAKMMQQMHAFKPAGNKDHDFAHHMMVHHQGAVDMAEVLLKEGKDATLRQMAEKILADQKKEIGQLEAVATRLDRAAKNYDPSNPQDPFQAAMTASMKPMMAPMTPSGDVDRDFAMMMTVHHQSAVDMAQLEVAQGTDAELKKMAQQMITEQQKEIQQFNDWLKQHGGAGMSKATSAVYECPMGCEGSRSTKPGKCPVCEMDLVKKS
ncbi:DUF305 domain-containing protein [Hymenobacter weizhouensis]|uniref:DUF305 domain-containing protein n=1 Tax=Hymenobacter sp. YIM 151500-1 TaxID=2987689 RepID=UPI0022272A64|nr:DUF305 domain-containing protein [Hymenobacter sp. YIM 151500-1]UYZ64878.1 DUF305 domain-containing protein [Hymenobacter sp. YIM 151500-1]